MAEYESHFGEPLAISALQAAGLHFSLGENEKGFEWLEKSYSRKEDDLLYIRTDELFDGIRSDPRYQDLLKRIGLEEGTLCFNIPGQERPQLLSQSAQRLAA